MRNDMFRGGGDGTFTHPPACFFARVKLVFIFRFYEKINSLHLSQL